MMETTPVQNRTYALNNGSSVGRTVAAIVALCLALTAVPATLAQPLPGAIFTTDSTCTGVNLNIFSSREDVYLNGGPAHPGAAGLPDGLYYVKVTEPNGTLLGQSEGSGNDTPVQVENGELVECYQLWAILIKASDSTPGYDATNNPGGEYKVWVSTDSSFPNSRSKTDNFKVRQVPGDPATLKVNKFYDANANGINDNEELITGWEILIREAGASDDIQRTTPVTILLDPGDYTVTERTPVEENWRSTTANLVEVTLVAGQTTTVEFGNLCLGEGNARTKGFWRSPNAPCNQDDLDMLSSLNLRNEDGSDFDPQSCDAFKSWLKSARAVNMAYMLSAQLAAMEMNVSHGFVDGNALIYARDPKTGQTAQSANSNGYASVNAIMDEANTELGKHGYTPAGDPNRKYQETLKDILDAANNNLTFVQPKPCPFSFAS